MRHALKVLIQTAISNSDVVRIEPSAINIGGCAGSTEHPMDPTDNSGRRKLCPKLEADIIAHAKKLAIAGPNSTAGFGPISCHLDALPYKIQIAR